MKLIVLASLVFFSSFSYSKGEKAEQKRDFSIVCAVSKAAQSLINDKYLSGEADRKSLVWGMIEKSIVTQEVKNVMRAISVASPDEKLKLMKQAADEVGLKNWKCDTLKFLF